MSVEQYHALIDAGYFARDERFELIDGRIVSRPIWSPRHASHVCHLGSLLDERLAGEWHVRTRSGFTLKRSEPEPDLVVVPGEPLAYATRHPGADDAAVVIEALDATGSRHRMSLRRRVYAEEGVRLYWLLNLVERVVEVYADPSGPARDPEFGTSGRYAGDDVLKLRASGRTISIRVNEILFRELEPA